MNTLSRPELDQVWQWLDAVPDPEIPVISLVDLGIIRKLYYEGETLVVLVTPTYSGCPATSVINADIEAALRAHGIENLRLERQLSPAWSTDWISEQGRKKLRDYGISPPVTQESTDTGTRIWLRTENNLTVACPRCGSTNTTKVSQFGSTPCKANYRCKDCLEPFDYFKCI
ncbi:MAG: phenylacetate-CoA oxygenase subunit PaaJ [Alcaligenaceae bacterium]|nr:phenylacetate-CoA oxygenase subunit PaaJ [Alcaligenaceae bacterium]